MTEWPNICPTCKGEPIERVHDIAVEDGEVLKVTDGAGREFYFGKPMKVVIYGCPTCKNTGTVIGETAKRIG